jgi:tRNA1(Val) A37 N6-methylase TrmN6
VSIESESFRPLVAQALAALVGAGLSVTQARHALRILAPAGLEALANFEHFDDVDVQPPTEGPVSLGIAYERLQATFQRSTKKRHGSFYTPSVLARRLCEVAFGTKRPQRVLDPSCGAGAILVGALAFVGPEALHGVDIDPVAVWIARITLAIESRTLDPASLARWCDRVRVGDALEAETFRDQPPFDAIIGNPPWVSYAGRSAEPISDEQRKRWKTSFRSFAGFPTAQGMFVERSASLLKPGGRLALLVPTTMADLAGYGPAREALTRVARVDDPLEELGFGRFDSVVQPTMILSATAVNHNERASRAPWRLAGGDATARSSLASSLIERLRAMPRFDRHTFGEGGFQSAKHIARTHLVALGDRASEPRFTVPLRTGSDVIPFACRAPSMALDPDPVALSAARCTLRAMDFYHRVTVLIRQTARFPIAARHEPVYVFRNSLLAGFSDDPLVLCALLNSSLLRAVHLDAQRDGRQAVFPQLKVAHLRALPAPPEGASLDALRLAAARAERAQFRKLAAIRAYGPCPRTAFQEKADRIEPSRAFLRSLKDGQQRARFDQALAAVREAHAEAFAAISECDALVFDLYDVREHERESVRAVLAAHGH